VDPAQHIFRRIADKKSGDPGPTNRAHHDEIVLVLLNHIRNGGLGLTSYEVHVMLNFLQIVRRVAMLAGARVRILESDDKGRPWSLDRHPVILAAVARPLLPFALLVAAYLFLRGHNLPGGGFIAALVVGTALVLQYVADGSVLARRRLGWDYAALIGAGVLIAAATGLGSWLFGYPFLTSSFTYLDLPVVGDIELATALFFDLGVFVTVVATVMLMLDCFGRLNAPLDTAPVVRMGERDSR
jgi:multicomponent K+:H+ antiporter subunit A